MHGSCLNPLLLPLMITSCVSCEKQSWRERVHLTAFGTSVLLPWIISPFPPWLSIMDMMMFGISHTAACMDLLALEKTSTAYNDQQLNIYKGYHWAKPGSSIGFKNLQAKKSFFCIRNRKLCFFAFFASCSTARPCLCNKDKPFQRNEGH